MPISALICINQLIVVCRAKEISNKFFSQRNGDSQHTIYAMGHSHIDTGIITLFKHRHTHTHTHAHTLMRAHFFAHTWHTHTQIDKLYGFII